MLIAMRKGISFSKRSHVSERIPYHDLVESNIYSHHIYTITTKGREPDPAIKLIKWLRLSSIHRAYLQQPGSNWESVIKEGIDAHLEGNKFKLKLQ